ncbi:MAG: hypothetical protein U0835_04050 [Isosphaeraceae bacterium]
MGRRLRQGRAARSLILAGLLGSTCLASLAQAGDPSPAYQAELRRTLELRRQRRRVEPRPPIGVIQTYPMPPALIIRHTRETHDEIGAFLDLLRYGGR